MTLSPLQSGTSVARVTAMAQTRKPESSTGLAESKKRVKPDLLDEEDEVVKPDPLADYEDFADPGDSNPDDRRRDPLRH